MSTARRPSFRRRLGVVLGVTLAAAFAVLGGALWLAFHVRANVVAQGVLDAEAREIARAIVPPRGPLAPEAYEWDEPHHVFAERRIDPYFVQVFDRDGRPLRASQNVARVRGYPARLLAEAPTDDVRLFRLPPRFAAGGARFYAVARPLRSPEGQAVGAVQIGRYDPGLAAASARWAAGLGGGLALTLGALLALLGAVARRAVRPLEAITAAAVGVGPGRLDRRVPVTPEADRESAQLAETLNAMLARLEAAFEETRRFTAHAAHELQTPVARLLGHADVALRRERPADDYRATLEAQRAELVRLGAVVRALLLLAELDRDALGAETEPVDLGAVVREEAALARPAAAARGLALAVEVDGAPLVLGHPTLLRELVRLALDNAVKYTDHGGVTVGAGREGEAVALEVADTGVGIGAEDLARVTERFYRGASSAGRPGHGLGLALAARIAAAHGTRIEVRSAPGAGTRLRLALPLAPG